MTTPLAPVGNVPNVVPTAKTVEGKAVSDPTPDAEYVWSGDPKIRENGETTKRPNESTWNGEICPLVSVGGVVSYCP